jgi:hypothetical protein
MATTKKTTKASTEKKTRVSIKKAIDNIQSTQVFFPKVTVGSHLTVTEFANGATYLAWNDDALLKEIQAATK